MKKYSMINNKIKNNITNETIAAYNDITKI